MTSMARITTPRPPRLADLGTGIPTNRGTRDRPNCARLCSAGCRVPGAGGWGVRGGLAVVEEGVFGFAGLLRQLRGEAGLTQEELAEAAGLSPRSVSDLERGINRTARKDTAVLLAGALGLPGPVRGVVRGRGPRAGPRSGRAGGAARDGAGSVRGGGDPGAAAGRRQLHRPSGRARAAGGRAGGWPRVAGWWGSTRSTGWPGSARPPSRCTRRTGWRAASRTASFSCRCTPTRAGSGRSSRPMRWPACC